MIFYDFKLIVNMIINFNCILVDWNGFIIILGHWFIICLVISSSDPTCMNYFDSIEKLVLIWQIHIYLNVIGNSDFVNMIHFLFIYILFNQKTKSVLFFLCWFLVIHNLGSVNVNIFTIIRILGFFLIHSKPIKFYIHIFTDLRWSN